MHLIKENFLEVTLNAKRECPSNNSTLETFI